MPKLLTYVVFGVTLAITVPAQAQSKPPTVPTGPADITLTCAIESNENITNTISAEIWSSAHVLKWTFTGSPTEIYSVNVEPMQISFSGSGSEPWPLHDLNGRVTEVIQRNWKTQGGIDRLTGRFNYVKTDFGTATASGTCIPASKPKF